MTEFSVRIGKNLKKLREEKWATKKAFVREFNRKEGTLSEQTYGKYENGEREPGIHMLYSLAKFHGVTMEYIIGISTTPLPRQNIMAFCDVCKLSPKSVRVLRDYAKMERNNMLKTLDYIIQDQNLLYKLCMYLMHSSEDLCSTRMDTNERIYAFRLGGVQLFEDDIKNGLLVGICNSIKRLKNKIDEKRAKEEKKNASKNESPAYMHGYKPHRFLP